MVFKLRVILQMFELMQRLWNDPAHNMDIPLTVYGVASLGFEVGLVEVVENSDTLSNIHARIVDM